MVVWVVVMVIEGGGSNDCDLEGNRDFLRVWIWEWTNQAGMGILIFHFFLR